jgi:hypothetical protein
MATKKPKAINSKKKGPNDNLDTTENPLLYVDDKINFRIETGNLLQTPSMLIFKDFDRIDIQKDKNIFDTDKLKETSSVIIILRYFEYVCIAQFEFSFIIPILESGLTAKDVIEMMKHALRNRLLLNAPSFDNIYDIDIRYDGYIRY